MCLRHRRRFVRVTGMGSRRGAGRVIGKAWRLGRSFGEAWRCGKCEGLHVGGQPERVSMLERTNDKKPESIEEGKDKTTYRTRKPDRSEPWPVLLR
jgi:hypothetical protein